MCALIKRLSLAWLLFSPLTFAENYTGKALLEVIINGENVGIHALDLDKDDVLVPVALFKTWRFNQQLWTGQGHKLSLRSLVPHVQYYLDHNHAQLTITASVNSFNPQVIQSQTRYFQLVSDDAIRPAPWSGFLNYALDADFREPQGFDAFRSAWEVGISAGRWFAFTNFTANYSRLNESIKMSRNNTFLQWEDTETRQRVILGDFQINSPTLSTSGRIGGVIWQSNFRQYGQFQYIPSFDLNVTVETPSLAELYINGTKTKEFDLLPGTVNLPSLLTTGQGDATLVLTDAFGREQLITQPFYITQQLLKPGLHDFFYGAGAKRKTSNKVLDYGDIVLFGSHRYGFSNTLTAGAAFTASRNISNVGISLSQSFFGNSFMDTAFTASRQNKLNGYLAVGRYQYNSGLFNYFVSGGYMSRYYGNLYTDAANLQKSKYRLQTSINFRIAYTGSSIGASYSQNASWHDRDINHNLSLFYRQTLFKALSLNIQANHNLKTGDNVAFLSLSFFPGIQNKSANLHNNNFSYQLSYDDKTHVDQQVWQTQKQGNVGEGYSYTAALQKRDDVYSGFARYQYKNNRGIYSANYAQDEQTISGNVGVAGSLSTINNDVYFGRPITDSFAVVKVQGTKDSIPIYNDGAFLGEANNNQDVIIPHLQSRRVGQVSIKPKDLNLGIIADRTNQALDIGVRTAHLVEFSLRKFIAVEGYAYTLAEDGSKQYLEALPLEYIAKGKIKNSFIATKGFFYLENVPIGEFKATVKRYHNDCILHLTVPESKKIVVKLGEVLCFSR